MDEVRVKGKQGFASMDPERQREIAKMGGSAVPEKSRIYSINREVAAAAGRKGGLARAAKYRQMRGGS